MMGEVLRAMTEHVSRYITPISRVISENEGELVGTGTYVRAFEGNYILTNEHVSQKVLGHRLAHMFHGRDEVLYTTNPFQALAFPVDAALSRVEETSWKFVPHTGDAVPVSRTARLHNPGPGELLFLMGYSGERSYFTAFSPTLLTPATPYLTQEIPLPENVDHNFHFALPYRPEQTVSVGRDRRGMPLPGGFSGTVVWNTKYFESVRNGRTWTPGYAEVTGLVHRWRTTDTCLIVTRVEHVRDFMLHAFRREAAYFRWLDQGSPPNSATTDWLWAEGRMKELH